VARGGSVRAFTLTAVVTPACALAGCAPWPPPPSMPIRARGRAARRHAHLPTCYYLARRG